MFVLIQKIFIRLLTSIVSASNHTNCVLLSNQKCIIQPTLINLHPNEYSQQFDCFAFAVKLNRYVGSCNTLNDLSNKVCVPNKTKDSNLNMFNMYTGTNEPNTLTKHIPFECKCRFDGRKCNWVEWWNIDKCWCECKNAMYVKMIMFRILVHVAVKMENI